MNIFDKKIKQKLSHAEMPVEDGIWEAIESRIIHQKDNSRFWFLLIIPLLFAPAALMMWNSTQQDTAETAMIENAALNPQYEQQTPYYATSDRTVVTNSNETLFAPAFSYPQLTTLPNLNRSANFLNTINSNYSGDFDFGFKLSGFGNSKATNSSQRSSSSKVSVINGEIISGYVTQDDLTPLPANQFSIASLDSEQRGLIDFFNNDPGAECHDFKVYDPGFYAYTQFTVDAPFQRLTAKNAGFNEYVARRDSSESSALSYSTTLGIGYRFDNGLFAESGLSIDRINMDFYLPEDNVRTTTIITIDTMITPNLDTIISTDTTRVQIDGGDPIFASNTFTQIDIPLVVGFEFPLSEKLRLGLKGGVLVNIRSSNSGLMVGINPEDGLIGYGSNSTNDSQYFKTNIGFSYTGGLNLEADLNESFSLYGGLNVRYYPNSFATTANPVNQSFTKLGLLAGLKYRI